MDSEIKSFIKVWIAAIASMCYCYFIVRHIPRGIARLFFLVPIFYLFIILPLNLYSVNLCGATAFYLVWLANFKLLLFSFDQGPLFDSIHQSKSLLCFISTALLPIKIRQDPPPKSHPNPKSKPDPPSKATPNPKSKPDPPPKASPKSEKPLDPPSNSGRKVQSSALLAIKVLLLAVVIRSYNYRQYFHPYFILVLYCCNLYLGLELVLAMSAVLARAMPGFEFEPQFNEPYLATSLQDFWGRRWNLVVPGILRPTVYGPIRSVSTPVLGRRWAALPATVAAFLVSGLMHEVMYFYLTRASPTWEVMWFFVLQGVCTAAEVAAKKAVAGRWRLHGAVSGPLTVGFVVVTGAWLFFPQLLRNGVDRKAIAEYSILADFVISRLAFF